MRTRFSGAIALAAGLAVCAPTLCASSFTIVPAFDSTITSLPNASTVETAINTVIANYESIFTDPISVYVTFAAPSGMGTTLGDNVTSDYVVSYAGFLSALKANANSTNAKTAVAQLPTSTTIPIAGVADNTQIALACADAQALGLGSAAGCSPSASSPDGTVNLNVSAITSGNYSLQTVISHELDEVLGLGSALNQSWAGSYILPEDLFRYNSSGGRSYGSSATAAAYFEITPGTPIMQFNNSNSSLDYGDWATVSHNSNYYYSYSAGNGTAYIQDDNGTSGATGQLALTSSSVETEALNVIGYQIVLTGGGQQGSGTTPEPATWLLVCGGAGLVAVRRRIAG